MSLIRNIWDELGFSGNPFHTDALRATEQDRAIYVRREELEGALGSWLSGEERGGIFVEGAVGVGKTTFVNQTQLAVHEHDDAVLPCDDVVEIQEGTTPVDLVLSIVASILRALQDHRPHIQGDRSFQQVEEEVRRTRIATWSGGASLLALGGQVGKTVTPTLPAAITLQSLQDLLERCQALLADQGFDKAVVILNNLDNVTHDHLWGLLHDIRNTLLQRPGLVFVFIGPPGVRTELAAAASHRRVSEVIANIPIEVGSLSRRETWDVVQARVAHFRLDPKTTSPVPRALVDNLYAASHGELRYVLNRLSDIVQLVARTTGLRGPLDENTAEAALRTLVTRDVFARNLSDRKMQVLDSIVRHGSAQPKQYAEFGFNNPQAFLAHLKELAEANLLDKETNPRDGRETIYRPRGDAVLFFQREMRWPSDR